MRSRDAITYKILASLFVLLACLAVGVAYAQQSHTVTTVTYIYTDAQGNVIAKADEQGNIIARYTYRPYGTQQSGPTNAGPSYTGHVHDPDTGLVYMQQRYYDPVVGRFISPDPVAPTPGNVFNFNRYVYANDSPLVNVDPDGRNATAALGGLFVESFHLITGRGFNGSRVLGALKDGYNGRGGGVLNAAVQDANTALVATGVAGLLKGAGTLVLRQTGEKIVANIAKNAIKDDVKGLVRQIIKDGGLKSFGKDARAAMRGGKTILKDEVEGKGAIHVVKHSDGTTVTARDFSKTGPRTIEVIRPSTDVRVKVRYPDND